MHPREETLLTRDVAAIQIPDGTRTLLESGMPVLITQQLGGSFTVMTDVGAMYRIDEHDADALGKEPPEGADGADAGSLDDRVWGQLRKCYDPEIPVNIVDLGLVYDCRVETLETGGHRVEIQMTLTAPGCGMGPVLADDVRRRVEGSRASTRSRSTWSSIPLEPDDDDRGRQAPARLPLTRDT
ncbi:MAG: iron-sulfur cluster assembly protein [Thermoanaerobaculia bacterium]